MIKVIDLTTQPQAYFVAAQAMRQVPIAPPQDRWHARAKAASHAYAQTSRPTYEGTGDVELALAPFNTRVLTAYNPESTWDFRF